MAQKRDRYHHGELKAALVDAAVNVLAERGVRNFSLAEVSRRLGVTTAAPYRHFADRDDLLAAVAVRALGTFTAMLTADVANAGAEPGSAAGTPPEDQLATLSGAYVRFAAQQRPLFDTIFNSGLDKSRHPELQRAWEPIDALLANVIDICDGDKALAEALADAVEASAHGHAMLLIDGEYGDGDKAVATASAKATAATRALIAGRHALIPHPSSPRAASRVL